VVRPAARAHLVAGNRAGGGVCSEVAAPSEAAEHCLAVAVLSGLAAAVQGSAAAVLSALVAAV
jgi:hypothetical protein